MLGCVGATTGVTVSLGDRQAVSSSTPHNTIALTRRVHKGPYLAIRSERCITYSLLQSRLVLGSLAGKQTRQAGHSNFAPAVELIRMEAVFRGQLVNGLLFAQYLLNQLSLECGRKVTFRMHGLVLP